MLQAREVADLVNGFSVKTLEQPGGDSPAGSETSGRDYGPPASQRRFPEDARPALGCDVVGGDSQNPARRIIPEVMCQRVHDVVRRQLKVPCISPLMLTRGCAVRLLRRTCERSPLDPDANIESGRKAISQFVRDLPRDTVANAYERQASLTNHSWIP